MENILVKSVGRSIRWYTVDITYKKRLKLQRTFSEKRTVVSEGKILRFLFEELTESKGDVGEKGDILNTRQEATLKP